MIIREESVRLGSEIYEIILEEYENGYALIITDGYSVIYRKEFDFEEDAMESFDYAVDNLYKLIYRSRDFER